MARITELDYWKNRTSRKIKDILIVKGGKMDLPLFLRELAREGYDIELLAPLLPKFSLIVIEDNKVALRNYQKRLTNPADYGTENPAIECREV